MEDPKYPFTQKVGGTKSSYSIDAFPRGGLQADQSFILEGTFVDEQSPGQPFDISGATATCYITAYKIQNYPITLLGAGVISDSGSGTDDTVTFTISKDLIPDDIATIAQGRTGNGVIYFTLEDADTKLTFSQIVNITDQNFTLTGDNSASSNVIIAGGNDLGTVLDSTLTAPPVSPNFNDSYIVGVGATGDWAGEDNNLAVWNGSAWIFRISEEGNFVFDANADGQIVFDGTSWGANVTDVDAVHVNVADEYSSAAQKATPVVADRLLIEDSEDSLNKKYIEINDLPTGASLPTPDTTSIVQGNVDDTKQMRIDVETNVSTATTRVASMPDKDITLGLDDDAIHTNVAGEIDGLTEKATPVGTDLIVIEDSADSNNKKKVQITNLPSGGGSSLPVDDTTSIVQDPVDNTRQMRIDVGAVAASNTRVLFMPDQNIDLTPDSGSFLSEVASDTSPQLGGTLDSDGNDIDMGDDSDLLNVQNIELSTYQEITISGGVVTATRNLHSIDTQADAATDDLDTITAGPSNLIYITQENASRVVTLKDGTGNLDIGADIEMVFGTVYQLINDGVNWQLVGAAASGGGGGGILPDSESTKTADYTILAGDIGTRLILGSGASADEKFTLDVSLFADSTEQISFKNVSDYRLEIEVSNTGTMTFNDSATNLYLWKGDGVLTINGDTATNADVVARG